MCVSMSVCVYVCMCVYVCACAEVNCLTLKFCILSSNTSSLLPSVLVGIADSLVIADFTVGAAETTDDDEDEDDEGCFVDGLQAVCSGVSPAENRKDGHMMMDRVRVRVIRVKVRVSWM